MALHATKFTAQASGLIRPDVTSGLIKEVKMQQAQAVNPIMNLLPLVFIFAIFYFMLIRPQKTKEKEHKNMLANLNKNDEIVTTGGIHGTVVAVKDKTITLRIDENVKMEIEKNCVAYLKKTQVVA